MHGSVTDGLVLLVGCRCSQEGPASSTIGHLAGALPSRPSRRTRSHRAAPSTPGGSPCASCGRRGAGCPRSTSSGRGRPRPAASCGAPARKAPAPSGPGPEPRPAGRSPSIGRGPTPRAAGRGGGGSLAPRPASSGRTMGAMGSPPKAARACSTPAESSPRAQPTPHREVPWRTSRLCNATVRRMSPHKGRHNLPERKWAWRFVDNAEERSYYGSDVAEVQLTWWVIIG